MGFDSFKQQNEKQEKKLDKVIEENRSSEKTNKNDKKSAPSTPNKKSSSTGNEKSNEKGKGGRTKLPPYKNRSIGIPDEYRMYVDIRAGVETEGNVNAFFRFLIEEDAKNHPDDFNYAQKKQAEQEKKSKKSEE